MLTKKMINAELPRIDNLRKWYRLEGQLGCFPDNIQMFSRAFIDIYVDGTADCRYYGYGDAYEPRHYYCEEDGRNEFDGGVTYDVTSLFEYWIRGDADRHATVNFIYNKIKNCHGRAS